MTRRPDNPVGGTGDNHQHSFLVVSHPAPPGLSSPARRPCHRPTDQHAGAAQSQIHHRINPAGAGKTAPAPDARPPTNLAAKTRATPPHPPPCEQPHAPRTVLFKPTVRQRNYAPNSREPSAPGKLCETRGAAPGTARLCPAVGVSHRSLNAAGATPTLQCLIQRTAHRKDAISTHDTQQPAQHRISHQNPLRAAVATVHLQGHQLSNTSGPQKRHPGQIGNHLPRRTPHATQIPPQVLGVGGVDLTPQLHHRHRARPDTSARPPGAPPRARPVHPLTKIRIKSTRGTKTFPKSIHQPTGLSQDLLDHRYRRHPSHQRRPLDTDRQRARLVTLTRNPSLAQPPPRFQLTIIKPRLLCNDRVSTGLPPTAAGRTEIASTTQRPHHFPSP